MNTSSVDARALELGEIPRIQKRSKGVEKQSPEVTTTDSSAAKKEKSKICQRERILRRRAKLRELYLLKLQELGKYDPNRPIKPDPERLVFFSPCCLTMSPDRWIPLKQRSYSKRGRKNRNKFVGGQGSGDGAQKDMQKLDAYARSHGADAGNKKQGVVIAAPTPTGGKKGRGKKR